MRTIQTNTPLFAVMSLARPVFSPEVERGVTKPDVLNRIKMRHRSNDSKGDCEAIH